MGESEVKSIEKALKKVNNVYKVLITVLLANILMLFGVAWWASNVETRVSHLEGDEVEIKKTLDKAVLEDDMVFLYNDYFTRYLWAERWSQPLPDPPYNTRGAVPNL